MPGLLPEPPLPNFLELAMGLPCVVGA